MPASGIAVSSSFRAAFLDFESDQSAFALPITITVETPETLKPLDTIHSSTDLNSSFSLIPPLLPPDDPLFLIIRRYPSEPYFLFATYVPDNVKEKAYFRRKTIFASTELAVKSGLGDGKFRKKSMFVTEPNELEWENVQKWERSEEEEPPLTEAEKQAESINDGEGAIKQGGTQQRREIGKAMKMEVDVGALERLEELRTGGNNLVILRIDIATETIKLDRTTTTDAKGLANEITGTEPRYSFFRYSEENKEGESPPIISIYTFPSISGVTQVRTKGKERMVYATSKLAFFDAARDELGLNIVKSIEFSDPSDITIDPIQDDAQPKQEQKQAFTRPKRPGKR